MSRRLICLMVSILVGTVAVEAAPVGNPAEINYEEDKTGLSAGFEGDYVFERDVEDDGELEGGFAGAKIGFAPLEQLQLYGLLGAAKQELKYTDILKIETDPAFMYGGGLTVVLFSNDTFGIGLDARYRRTTLDMDEVTVFDATASVPDSEYTYSDWQVALGAALNIFESFVPYIGVKYNDLKVEDVKIAGSTIDGDVGSDKVVGIFTGFDVNVSKDLKLNLEGRFIDELAISCGGTILF